MNGACDVTTTENRSTRVLDDREILMKLEAGSRCSGVVTRTDEYLEDDAIGWRDYRRRRIDALMDRLSGRITGERLLKKRGHRLGLFSG
jgi:hypothetical protein